jgi:ceramide glucosyltransferase
MSILKPLSGDDLGLEENLRTFFEQNYPCFEILFAVRSRDDSATAVAERLRAAFPAVPSRLLVTGEPSYPNAKVFSLDQMLAEASCELLVMADSDVSRRGPSGALARGNAVRAWTHHRRTPPDAE